MSAVINSNGATSDGRSGSLVHCGVDQLHPHPAYALLDLAVSASELSALIERGDTAFKSLCSSRASAPLLTGMTAGNWPSGRGGLRSPALNTSSRNKRLLSGFSRNSARSRGVNNFCRILLALELEPGLKQRAHANQRHGGLRKGSSNLTEADRLDVRAEIAATAGVSTGNVNKVKQILTDARPELILALRTGEVSIHRGWCWLKEPERQLEHL